MRNSEAERALKELVLFERSEPTGRPTDMVTLLVQTAQLAGRLDGPDERIRALEQAAKLSEQRKLNDMTINVLAQLENAYYTQKRFEDAIPLSAKLYRFAQSNSNFSLLCQSMRSLGAAHGALGHKGEAEIWFKKALSTAREHKDRGETAISLISYGEYLRYSTRSEEAMKCFTDALSIASKNSSVSESCLITANMDCGNAELSMGNYPSSERYYRAGIEHHPLADQRGFALYRIASLCSYQGKIEQALDIFRQTVRVAADDELLRLQVWCGSVTACWLVGRGDEGVISWKESAGKRVERLLLWERINYLGRIFLPNFRMLPAPDVSGCRKIINAMRSKLGANDPYYVSMTKEFATLLDICGYKSEADSLSQLAEMERRHVSFGPKKTK